MPKSGLKHIDVGNELTKTEWESEESHELLHGTSFPASPVERQLFYRDDEHKWYIYDGSAWVWLGGGGGGGGGSGDMLKSVYDTDDDGVVDNAEKLEGSTKAQVQDHTPKAHTLASHSTKAHSELTGVGTDDHHVKYTDAEAKAQAEAAKLDDHGAPDDNTDLDASPAKHGLMPKADKSKLDGIEPGADVTGSNPPQAHAASHENGGGDEISVAGLSGELADGQPPKAHALGGAAHNADTLANLNAKISDATLDDSSAPRDPNAHKASHQDGGADEISIAGLSGDPADTINKSLLTVRGDIIYRDASAPARLAKGIAGAALLMGADDPTWSSPPLVSIAAKTYYIDAVSGDDGNGGESSGDAFKTWAKAETMIPVFIMHDYEVITLGNLSEDFFLEGRTTISGGSLSIKGDKETTPYYTVNKIDVLSCFGDIRIQYFRTTTDRTFVGYSMLPRLDGVRFIHHDASSTSRAFDLEACIMGLRDCNVGTDKAQDGIFATNCRLVSHDNSGNATRYGIYANNSAVVAKRNGQPTGTTANESTAFGGVIR